MIILIIIIIIILRIVIIIIIIILLLIIMITHVRSRAGCMTTVGGPSCRTGCLVPILYDIHYHTNNVGQDVYPILYDMIVFSGIPSGVHDNGWSSFQGNLCVSSKKSNSTTNKICVYICVYIYIYMYTSLSLSLSLSLYKYIYIYIHIIVYICT